MYTSASRGIFSRPVFLMVAAATLPKCLVTISSARLLLEERVRSQLRI